MHVNKITDLINADEPHLGTITEDELIQADGEGLDILLNVMEDIQEYPEKFTTDDDITGEPIELITTDYLDSIHIDMLNSMFIEDNGWEYNQLKFIVANLQLRSSL